MHASDETMNDTHSLLVGYLLWIFGFLGLHRFYLGKPWTGLLFLLTCGIFLIGVIYDWWTVNEQISKENMLYRNQ